MEDKIVAQNFKSIWWRILRGVGLLIFITISCCGCLLFIGFTSDAEPRTVRATIGFSESSESNTPTIDIPPTSNSTPSSHKNLYPTQTPSRTPSRTPTFTKEPTSYATQMATRVSVPTLPTVPTVPTVQQTQTPTLSNTCQGGCFYETEGCSIKGNVNSEGEKIYHYPNGQYYNRTVVNVDEGDRWFCTGAEAEANGFRASSR